MSETNGKLVFLDSEDFIAKARILEELDRLQATIDESKQDSLARVRQIVVDELGRQALEATENTISELELAQKRGEFIIDLVMRMDEAASWNKSANNATKATILEYLQQLSELRAATTGLQTGLIEAGKLEPKKIDSKGVYTKDDTESKLIIKEPQKDKKTSTPKTKMQTNKPAKKATIKKKAVATKKAPTKKTVSKSVSTPKTSINPQEPRKTKPIQTKEVDTNNGTEKFERDKHSLLTPEQAMQKFPHEKIVATYNGTELPLREEKVYLLANLLSSKEPISLGPIFQSEAMQASANQMKSKNLRSFCNNARTRLLKVIDDLPDVSVKTNGGTRSSMKYSLEYPDGAFELWTTKDANVISKAQTTQPRKPAPAEPVIKLKDVAVKPDISEVEPEIGDESGDLKDFIELLGSEENGFAMGELIGFFGTKSIVDTLVSQAHNLAEARGEKVVLVDNSTRIKLVTAQP